MMTKGMGIVERAMTTMFVEERRVSEVPQIHDFPH